MVALLVSFFESGSFMCMVFHIFRVWHFSGFFFQFGRAQLLSCAALAIAHIGFGASSTHDVPVIVASDKLDDVASPLGCNPVRSSAVVHSFRDVNKVGLPVIKMCGVYWDNDVPVVHYGLLDDGVVYLG